MATHKVHDAQDIPGIRQTLGDRHLGELACEIQTALAEPQFNQLGDNVRLYLFEHVFSPFRSA